MTSRPCDDFYPPRTPVALQIAPTVAPPSPTTAPPIEVAQLEHDCAETYHPNDAAAAAAAATPDGDGRSKVTAERDAPTEPVVQRETVGGAVAVGTATTTRREHQHSVSSSNGGGQENDEPDDDCGGGGDLSLTADYQPVVDAVPLGEVKKTKRKNKKGKKTK